MREATVHVVVDVGAISVHAVGHSSAHFEKEEGGLWTRKERDGELGARSRLACRLAAD